MTSAEAPDKVEKLAFDINNSPASSIIGLIQNGSQGRERLVKHVEGALSRADMNRLGYQAAEVLRLGGSALASVFELSLENVEEVVVKLAEDRGGSNPTWMRDDRQRYVAQFLTDGICIAGETDLASSVAERYDFVLDSRYVHDVSAGTPSS